LIEIKVRVAEARQAIAMTRRTTPFRIVVVEDDAPLLGALAFALEAEGWEVSSFSQPTEALVGVVQADCLLVDYGLPQIDGLTLISNLRQRGVAAPAILITARPDDRLRQRAGEAGVAIVEKPLMAGELKRQIEAALRASRA
jgi:two-component system, LuxR family, response regulator FixJ